MMSMPPGTPPPGPPAVPPDDGPLGRGRRSDEADDADAAAEALGYADAEDAPIATDDEPDTEGSPEEDASQGTGLDGPELRDAELTKAEEADHPRPTAGPEANPYTRPS